ncbi:MAG: hypothetical protein BWK80_07335 [Desulfobacteraceae bacterium IS3]|nr:MAG: hypothetical protein BWK80_07335 [Desulfobacteraceae bacterium IS3]
MYISFIAESEKCVEPELRISDFLFLIILEFINAIKKMRGAYKPPRDILCLIFQGGKSESYER